MKKKYLFIVIIGIVSVLITNNSLNAQLKFMGVPMTTLKSFGDNIQKVATLNNFKVEVGGVSATIEDYYGVPDGSMLMVFNLSNVKRKTGANNDMNNAKIAHIVLKFGSMLRGLYLTPSGPDDNYKEFYKLLEILEDQYGKPKVSNIDATDVSINKGTNLIWKLKAGDIELTNDGNMSKIVFSDRANSNLKTKVYTTE